MLNLILIMINLNLNYKAVIFKPLTDFQIKYLEFAIYLFSPLSERFAKGRGNIFVAIS